MEEEVDYVLIFKNGNRINNQKSISCIYDSICAITKTVAKTIVVDTSVFISALRSARGKNRDIIRLCLQRELRPLIGTSLFMEMEDVIGRTELFTDCPISDHERKALFYAFISVCQWTHVYYLWRPNLSDEGDNHVMELAVAGGAEAIVTNNLKHFKSGELLFPEIKIMRPSEYIKELK